NRYKSLIKANPRNDTSYYTSTKFMSFLNTKNGNETWGVGYDKNSMFRKFDYYYAGRNVLFSLDSKLSSVYVIHNPEPILYKYEIESQRYDYIKKINLNPDWYNLKSNQKFKGNEWGDLPFILSTNSQYTSLTIFDDYILTCYRTGISKSQYKEMKSNTQLS